MKTRIKQLHCGLMSLTLSAGAFAGPMGSPAPEPMPWHFYIGIGYANYAGVVDANAVQQRLAGSRDLFELDAARLGQATIGLELGAQTGLSSRFWATNAVLDDFGGPAIQATIDPFFDVLGTVSLPLHMPKAMHMPTQMSDSIHMPQFISNFEQVTTDVFAKVGMAYRQMHFDRQAISSKTQISPEVQAGINFQVTPHMGVALAYQGIYTSTPRLVVTSGGGAGDATGYATSIPSQNGGLIVMSWRG